MGHLDLDLDALYIGNNPLGNIGAEKLLCYNVLNYSVTHTLRHIDLSNCNLGDNGAIHFSTASKNWNRIESANLSNNAIGDQGARAIANAFYHGEFRHLKGLDFHGNKISQEGYGYLAKILETVPRQMQTKDIAITLEVHREPRSSWEFIKHAAKYIFDQHYERNQAASKAAVAVYGDNDWAHCKKLLSDANREMAFGIVKNSANPLAAQLLQKAPANIKGYTVGAIFMSSAVETALGIDVTNLGYCIAAINGKWGQSNAYDPNQQFFSPELIGDNGEYESF